MSEITVNIPFEEYEKMKAKINELCDNQMNLNNLKSSENVVVLELGKIEVNFPRIGILWYLPKIKDGNKKWDEMAETIKKIQEDAGKQMEVIDGEISRLKKENADLKQRLNERKRFFLRFK